MFLSATTTIIFATMPFCSTGTRPIVYIAQIAADDPEPSSPTRKAIGCNGSRLRRRLGRECPLSHFDHGKQSGRHRPLRAHPGHSGNVGRFSKADIGSATCVRPACAIRRHRQRSPAGAACINVERQPLLAIKNRRGPAGTAILEDWGWRRPAAAALHGLGQGDQNAVAAPPRPWVWPRHGDGDARLRTHNQ